MGTLLIGSLVFFALFIVTAIIVTTMARKSTLDISLKKEFT